MNRHAKIQTVADAGKVGYDDGFHGPYMGMGESWPYALDLLYPDAFVRAWMAGWTDGNKAKEDSYRPEWAY